VIRRPAHQPALPQQASLLANKRGRDLVGGKASTRPSRPSRCLPRCRRRPPQAAGSGRPCVHGDRYSGVGVRMAGFGWPDEDVSLRRAGRGSLNAGGGAAGTCFRTPGPGGGTRRAELPVGSPVLRPRHVDVPVGRAGEACPDTDAGFARLGLDSRLADADPPVAGGLVRRAGAGAEGLGRGLHRLGPDGRVDADWQTQNGVLDRPALPPPKQRRGEARAATRWQRRSEIPHDASRTF
jgi:hypothetical protein